MEDKTQVIIYQFAKDVHKLVGNAPELSDLLFEKLEYWVSSLAFVANPALVSHETRQLLIQVLDTISWAYNNRENITIDEFKGRLQPILVQLKHSVNVV